MESRADFVPIKLINTRKYMPKGYRICEITKVDYQMHNKKKVFRVEFRVAKGKYKGFKLATTFYLTSYNSRRRFSYFCNAAGIRKELNDPEQLKGRSIRVLVKPEDSTYRAEGLQITESPGFILLIKLGKN